MRCYARARARFRIVTMTNTSIAIAADETYLPGLLACLHGLARHAAGAEVVIIDCGLGESSRRAVHETVAGQCRVSFQEPQFDVFTLGTERYPAAMYCRLFLGRHAFINRRVLYLDADTIILGSLSELLGTPLRDQPIAAVRDYHTPTISDKDGLPDWQELGLDAGLPFFNSGVLLVDLDRWEGENLERAAVTHARRYQAISCNDQHALNAAFAGRWHELPPIWNATRFWFKPERRAHPHGNILSDARIVHFVGPHKPWKHGADVPEAQLDRFFRALDGTALAGWRPERSRDDAAPRVPGCG
jgi:lipopolysaccharide biosynthesis glycosyltransferase